MLAYRHHPPHSHHHHNPPLSQHPHQLSSSHYYTTETDNSEQYIISPKSNPSPTNSQHSQTNYSPTHFKSNLKPEVTASSQPLQDFYYMPTTPLYNPPIRVQQSTPTPGEFHSPYQPTIAQPSWAYTEQLRPEARRQRFQSHQQQGSHKRTSSASSIASLGPASPHTPTTNVYPRIVDSESASYPSPGLESFDHVQQLGAVYSKPLPNSSQASYQQSYFNPEFRGLNTSNYDALLYAPTQSAMTHDWMAQNNADMGDAGSVTQRTSYTGEEYEDNFKTESRNIIPKLDRTISDICQDELWNPEVPTTTPTSQSRPGQNSLLSPYKGVFSERLQAANNEHISARSASPATTVSRERSPYRPGHEHVAEDYLNANNAPPRLGTASQVRGQQKAQADARELMEHQQKVGHLGSPKTISPKQTSLDYQESVDDANMPLFPQTDVRSCVSGPPKTPSTYQQNTMQSTTGDCVQESRRNKTATIPCTSSADFVVSIPAQPAPNYAFAPPAVPNNIQIPQEYPFISHLQSQDSSRRSASDQTPEFPSRLALTSMESTKSDSGTKSEHSQSESSRGTPRPSNTAADTGTYSCTYRGCSLRFPTPQKLQKHKREYHRQSTPQTGNNLLSVRGSPGSSSNNVSSSAASRNSQAGPHRCDRINPSTGKPCNSIFSRPYDLTRHEDTIHNARKQKVRCSLCTEEKIFSRNDALTRHMRVVHPEVDFPGKTKRKGGA